MVALMREDQLPRWRRDEGAEGRIAEVGLQYEYLLAPIGAIDLKAGLQNQARLSMEGVLREDLVEAYRADMLSGDVFPAIVVYQAADGSFVVMGGNHRVEAARRAGLTHIQVYVIRTQDEAIRSLLTSRLNSVEGWRPDPREDMEQAIHWMTRYGRTAKAAAIYFHLRPEALHFELRVREAVNRAARLGFPSSALKPRVLEALNRIPNDGPFAQALFVATTVGLNAGEAERLSMAVRGQSSEAGQASVVQAFVEDPEIARRIRERRLGIKKPSTAVLPKHRLLSACRTILGLQRRGSTLQQLGMTEEGKLDEARRIIDAAAKQLLTYLEGGQA